MSRIMSRMKSRTFKLILFACLVAAGSARAANAPPDAGPFSNLAERARELGLLAWKNQAASGRTVRVAIFDSGFAGYQDELGRSLPSNAQFHPRAAGPTEGAHGLEMAQIFTGLLRAANVENKLRVELHLFEISDLKSLREAVQDAIRLKIEVVSQAQVWAFGGNWDGGGIYNAAIDPAIKAGVLWLNAAGEFGGRAVDLPISFPKRPSLFDGESAEDALKDGRPARLPGEGQSLEISCQMSAPCPVRIFLSWNAFGDQPELGTDKDLRLELWSRKGRGAPSLVTYADVKQSSHGEPGTSPAPLESIQKIEIRPPADGFSYYVRVRTPWPERFGAGDRLRVMVGGEGVELENGALADGLANPADHPQAIAVGASDDPASGQSAALAKPEIALPSMIRRTRDGLANSGSSAAVTEAAAVAAVMLAYKQNRSRDDLLDAGTAGSGRFAAAELNFAGLGENGCFERAELPPNHPGDAELLTEKLGGVPVATNRGIKIFFERDPRPLISADGGPRFSGALGPGNALIVSRRGLIMINRALDQGDDLDRFEVLERPSDARFCRASPFRMPSPDAWIGK